MDEKKKFPWAIVIGAGCLVILCIVVLVGGVAAFFITQRSASPAVVEEVIEVTEAPLSAALESPTAEAVQVQPTDQLTQMPEPTQEQPEPSGPALTGEQQISETYLYDDFSSDALGWPVFDDGMTILMFQNETYSFQIAEPAYYDWAYFPVDFIPYEISFDVQGIPGQQEGTFGLFCQFQDEENYYYVEIDLEDNYYLVGQILEDESIPLTEADDSGEYWHQTSTLQSPPTSVNHIGVSCYLDSITLFINNELVDEVSVSQPFTTPGEAAFFVFAYEDAGIAGYQVFFDNVEAYQPVQ